MEKPLSGRARGFTSLATMTPAQITRAVAAASAKHPMLHADDLAAGALSMVVVQAAQEVADMILDQAEEKVPLHVDLIRKIRARGARIRIEIVPMDPGEGEQDRVDPIPLGDREDLEVIALTETGGERCGVMGCELKATHVIRSLRANSGSWACQCHAAQVEAAIAAKRKLGGG